jgi:integrase
MFLLLLQTGVRSGECAGLQWGDIDFNGKFVIVRRTVLPSGRIEKTKTDRVRRVDMSDDLAAVLIAHRIDRQKRALKSKKPLPEWVFADNDGKQLDMHNVKSRAFLLALQKAGSRRIRILDLRHSYASNLISAGISPAYVQ